MKRSSKIILATVLGLGLVGGVAAYGKHHFGDPTKLAEHMVERVSDELELTAVQAQSLRELAGELVKLKTTMKQDMSTDRQVIRDMITAPNFDQAKAIDMLSAKTTLIENDSPMVMAALGKFLDGLTAAQKAEITEHMDHHSRHHHRRHDD